jgi:hypothetical protein
MDGRDRPGHDKYQLKHLIPTGSLSYIDARKAWLWRTVRAYPAERSAPRDTAGKTTRPAERDAASTRLRPDLFAA